MEDLQYQPVPATASTNEVVPTKERPPLPEGTPRCLAEPWCGRPAGHAGRCIGRVEQMTNEGSIGTGPDRSSEIPADVSVDAVGIKHGTLGVPLALRRDPTPKDMADPRFDVLWELMKRVEAAEAQLASLTVRAQQLEAHIHDLRPKAECYERVCQRLGIESNIIGHVNATNERLAQVEQLVNEMRAEDWYQHTQSPLSVETVVNQWAERLSRLIGGHDQP